MRALALLAFGCSFIALALWGLLRLGGVAGPPELVLAPAAWSRLKGWTSEDPRAALAAFRRSCVRLDAMPTNAPIGGAIGKTGAPLYGYARDWQGICASASAAAPKDAGDARQWFEMNFHPVSVRNRSRRQGLFTGYYEPEAEGSLTRSDIYSTPLLRRPDDLVMVDLGAFRASLKGQRIAGRVIDGRLYPYQSRAEIEDGALDAQKLAIVWLKDPVAAFYLEIQGSGRIRLPNGKAIRVEYDGQNGYPYTPIGRVLRERGALDRKNISMQTIKTWLGAHPEQARSVMDANQSYVFFKSVPVEDPALGPQGGEGIALTPGRSLAVDTKYNAYGVPIWLETSLPKNDAGAPGAAFRRLMIAQDTGGAIIGPVRGDVFFGFGDRAEALAGRMKQAGEMFVLLPKSLAPPQ